MQSGPALADAFRGWSEWAEPQAPLYSRLAARIAETPMVLSLLESAPRAQRIPVMLFAAVHDLVLADPSVALAQWYRSVVQQPRDDDPFPTFQSFCSSHEDHLRTTISTRHVQTNEIGRCAFLLPVLDLVAREVGQLNLIDVGTSAGLNLRLDHYAYAFDPGGSLGDADAMLEIGTRGDLTAPEQFPAIGKRIGLDPRPIDIDDAESARWLTACVWPDQHHRLARLRSALDIARSVPADIRRVDAVTGITAALTDSIGDGHPVAMSSWVMNYLSEQDRVEFLDRLDAFGSEQDLSYVYAEAPNRCSGLPFPVEPAIGELTVIMLLRWRNGARTVDHVATAHPHGRWLHWGDAKLSFTAR